MVSNARLTSRAAVGRAVTVAARRDQLRGSDVRESSAAARGQNAARPSNATVAGTRVRLTAAITVTDSAKNGPKPRRAGSVANRSARSQRTTVPALEKMAGVIRRMATPMAVYGSPLAAYSSR